LIQTVPETGSTNADLAARLHSGEQVLESHWLIADRQTSGHGRKGREWHDGAGNFMGSTVVHIRHGDAAPASLALLAGLALYEVISPLLQPPHNAVLKWPNDVLIGRAKLAGILLEREGGAVIIGIGVNLVSAPALPDRQTMALAAITEAPERDAFAAALASQFTLELDRWRSFGLSPIVSRWLRAGTPVGTRITAEGQEGTFAGLTPEGSLQLRLADGSLQTIHAGEVNLTD
jgi:BirA family biotin operon repressor/biotin-[acetyl-CoA-carboxylase] ligase